MKNTLIQKIAFLLLFFAVLGCKKNNEVVEVDNMPLYQQIGAIPKKYSSLNVTPGTLNKSLSADFVQVWNQTKADMKELGGRELTGFVIKFKTATELDVVIDYSLPGDIKSEAIFNYTYTVDAQGNTSLTYVGANQNAENIISAMQALKENYLERYKFKIDWIDDKLPGSKEILAAYYRSDKPDSYFYGVIGVKEVGANAVEDYPIYKQIGFDKKFTGINVTPETYTLKISDDFFERWNEAKTAIFAIGERKLNSFDIKFISATQLTINFYYNPSGSTGTATATFTCSYNISTEGYLESIVVTGKNANANVVEPGLTGLLTDYLLKHKFRVDWIEDKLPGTRGTVAAYHPVDEPSSFFYGNLIYVPLYQQMGYGKKYSSLTVTPEESTSMISDDFLNRWTSSKTNLFANGSRQLKSFVLKFTSATQLNITYTYLTSAGGTATAQFVYSYVLDSQGLLKLTYVSRNANGTVIAPSIIPLTDDYLHTYQFKLDWLAGSQTLAAYYRADAPVSYFYGVIGN